MTRSHCCQYSAHYGDWFKVICIPTHVYTQMVNYRFNSMERTGAKNTNLGKMQAEEQDEKDWQPLIVLPRLNGTPNDSGKKETRLENESLHKGSNVLLFIFWTSATGYFCFIIWNNMVLILQIHFWMLKLMGSSSNKHLQTSLTSMSTGVKIYVIVWSTYTGSRFYGTKHCHAPYSASILSEQTPEVWASCVMPVRSFLFPVTLARQRKR